MSDALAERLGLHAELVVAVSGGVDSMTLAAFAHRLWRDDGMGSVAMVHAVSPAVPPAATERVRTRARVQPQQVWRWARALGH